MLKFTYACMFAGKTTQLINVYETYKIKGCTNKAVAHARYIDGVRIRTGDSVAIEKGNVTYKALCRKHWRE